MNVIKTKLDGVYILEPRVFGDSRGWFMESWSKRALEESGLTYDFVQDNHSFSSQKDTLRGIPFSAETRHRQKSYVAYEDRFLMWRWICDRIAQPTSNGFQRNCRRRIFGNCLSAGIRARIPDSDGQRGVLL